MLNRAKNGKKITAFVPRDGCLNFVDENDSVIVCSSKRFFSDLSLDLMLFSAGVGKHGKSKGDMGGVRHKVIKVSGVSLLALFKEKKGQSTQIIGIDRRSCSVREAPFVEHIRLSSTCINYIFLPGPCPITTFVLSAHEID